ncbi:hypothetical protein EJJ20_26025 [Pseudomonas poae]|nr:hypothetical protein EJJ20_26025 [Pseudomonas poae]
MVQAAWLLLLQRYTGQSAVAFGATQAGRPAQVRGAEEQIGLFINTLPIIAAPTLQKTVGEWLQQVQHINLAVREHEHTPLFEIQRLAGLGAKPCSTPCWCLKTTPWPKPCSKALPPG